MKNAILEEEQQDVDRTIEEIEAVISKLENRHGGVLNDIEHQYVQSSIQTKLAEYKRAIGEPYIGKLELIEDDQVVTYRIGKIGVSKDEVSDIIYDWRTPLGNVYYGFTGGDGMVMIATPGGNHPIFINRKRSVYIRQQRVIDVRDVLSTQFRQPSIQSGDLPSTEVAPDLTDDRLTQIWFEKDTDYQIKEIIATIQAEQNEIIRLGLNRPVLVQGVAGSGKTSIALHRISYLLYEYRQQLSAEKILILAPNNMFIAYMRQVVKDLDITGIQQSTVIDFSKQMLKFLKEVISPQQRLMEYIESPIYNANELFAMMKHKTSLTFKEEIDQFLLCLEKDFLPAPIPQFSYFVQPEKRAEEKWREIYEGYKHLPLNKRRTETIQSIQNWLELELKRQEKYLEERFFAAKREWIGDLDDSLVVKKEWEAKLYEIFQFKLNRMKNTWQTQVKQYLNAWPKLNTMDCYIRICERKGWPVDHLKRNHAGYEDLGALLHLERRIEGLHTSLQYLVIDEVQDLNPYLIDSLKPIANSMTMLGDLSQNIYPSTGFANWDSLPSIFGDQLQYMEITISYRSTFEIMHLANHILQKISDKFPVIQPINRHGNVPRLIQVEDGADLLEKLQRSIEQLRNEGKKKIAVICKENRLCEALFKKMQEVGVKSLQLVDHAQVELTEEVVFISVSLVKGLEFDAVIIPNATDHSFSSELDAKLLFVSVTRAQEDLHLLYYGQPSRYISDYDFHVHDV